MPLEEILASSTNAEPRYAALFGAQETQTSLE